MATTLLQSCHMKRALQMLVAATVAIIIYKCLHLNYGYWIALSAIITIQATTGASIKRARDRLLGTIMGVLVGIALINLLAQHTNFLLFTVPVLIFFSIYLFSTSYSISIFFVSILLIILMANGATSLWHFAFARIIDTAIGLCIGIIACYLLWPNASQDELQQNLQNTLCACQHYFTVITANYLAPQQQQATDAYKAAIENALLTSINSFKNFSYEPGIMQVTAEAVYAFIVSINAIFSSLMAINIAVCAKNSACLTDPIKERIAQFMQQIDAAFKQIANNIVPTKPQIFFDFDTFRTDVALLDEQNMKAILTERKSDEISQVLFVYHLKKIAFELKYMNQAVAQLVR